MAKIEGNETDGYLLVDEKKPETAPPPITKKLTRDDVLRAKDVHTEVVDVPEWGGSLTVRGMTGRERDKYEQSMLQPDKKGVYKPNMTDARARIVAICAVDDDGKAIFSPEDVLILSTKSAAALDRVSSVCSVLSGISDKDLDDLLGNSESDQSDDSISA